MARRRRVRICSAARGSAVSGRALMIFAGKGKRETGRFKIGRGESGTFKVLRPNQPLQQTGPALRLCEI